MTISLDHEKENLVLLSDGTLTRVSLIFRSLAHDTPEHIFIAEEVACHNDSKIFYHADGTPYGIRKFGLPYITTILTEEDWYDYQLLHMEK